MTSDPPAPDSPPASDAPAESPTPDALASAVESPAAGSSDELTFTALAEPMASASQRPPAEPVAAALAVPPADLSAPAPSPSPPTSPPLVTLPVALALSASSGLCYFLGFPGFDRWPLALVSLTPLLLAIRGRTPGASFRLGWLMGTITNAGGFYWIVSMLRTFSGFPTAVCLGIAAIMYVVQGFFFATWAWLVSRAQRTGYSTLLAAPAALGAIELAFPQLFPSYTANSLHTVPLLVQTADLGGPIPVSMVMALGHAAVEHALAPPGPAPPQRRYRPLAAVLALWAVMAIYGALRIRQVDVENRTAPALRVAVVQENLGLLEKRNEPAMALDRHLETSRALQARGVDLIVWSESAVAFLVDSRSSNVRRELPPWNLNVPVLFGALSMRDERLYNTAFMTRADGSFAGTYDKTYLLAFGEYLPGSQWFPSFHRLSPRSGDFTPGTRRVALPLPGDSSATPRTILPLICYEDVLPRFVRDFNNAARPSLFAVILNDAWFGDSTEPWIHLALSKFRSIEHRRDFVRAANSGVSGFVDAAGRVIANTGTFRTAASVATVHLRTRGTVYDVIGDALAWIALGAMAWMARPWKGRRPGNAHAVARLA